MRCYIIRHAEKEQGDFHDVRLRHQDPPISEQGRCDARELYAFFRGKPVTAIYVSAYQRTGQTIEHVAGQLRLVPVVDERLNEIDNGCIEGFTDKELEHRFPDVWRAYVARSADFRFPEGETGEEAQHRIVAFLEEKRRLQDSDEIIVVSHDGLIRLLMCHVVHLPVYERWTFQVDTCSITEIVSQPDSNAWKLIRFNQRCQS
jgi:broad specificity phosphatase PhoE